jgi:hypothetical protein
MNSDNDFMEYGKSHLVALPDGWYFNKQTKETIDPNGCVFNEKGELMYDPADEENQPLYDKDDYDFFRGI